MSLPISKINNGSLLTLSKYINMGHLGPLGSLVCIPLLILFLFSLAVQQLSGILNHPLPPKHAPTYLCDFSSDALSAWKVFSHLLPWWNPMNSSGVNLNAIFAMKHFSSPRHIYLPLLRTHLVSIFAYISVIEFITWVVKGICIIFYCIVFFTTQLSIMWAINISQILLYSY